MPSEHSVDVTPASHRLPPVTLESLASRLEDLEHKRDSGEVDALREEIEGLRAGLTRIERALAEVTAKLDKFAELPAKVEKLAEVVGESPDDAAGTPGKGVRKTLAEVKRAQTAQPWSAHIAAAMAAVLAIYQVLKGFGILK